MCLVWRAIEDSNPYAVVRSHVSSPLDESHTRPIFVSFTCGNRKHTRHCTVHDAALGLVPCFRTVWWTAGESNSDFMRAKHKFYH